MNMHPIDWSIVAALTIFITGMAIYSRRYTRSVADFLAANRCAGRYLLTIARGEVGASAVAMVAYFELFYQAGFTGIWWQMMALPTTLIIVLSGFVIYRFRQTRAMTVAQFFQMRYSRRFRIFMGFLAFTAGIINFGIFPAVGARFFIHYCGLPVVLGTIGPLTIGTYPVVMMILLGISLLFTLTGGQITVMITDFFEGLFTNIMILVIIVVIFLLFSWSQMSEAILMAPADASMVHPLHTSKPEGFSPWYFVMWVALGFYRHKAWQGSAGYDCAALTPHEAKMGGILSQWRKLAWWLMLVLLVCASYTLMHHPDFAAQAQVVNGRLSQIDNPTIQNQQTVSVAMGQFLPIGIMGAMCAVVLAAFVSTHNTYMHSWGSIFIQDVVMPFRKKPFDTAQHLRLLRLSIAGVAVFIFFFSLLFEQNDYILMFWELTGAIFTGGAGAAIIGGLYWKRGTTLAAWISMCIGSGLAATGMAIRQFDPDFFLNGIQIAFFSAIVASSTYVFVSLLQWSTSKTEPFNMDKMLHHGRYATEDTKRLVGSPTHRLLKKLGMTDEFTRGDQIIYLSTIVWSVSWFSIFLVTTIYCAIVDVRPESWLGFWKFYIWLHFAVGAGVLVWLGIGGVIDVRKMFKIGRLMKARLSGNVQPNRAAASLIGQSNPAGRANNPQPGQQNIQPGPAGGST